MKLTFFIGLIGINVRTFLPGLSSGQKRWCLQSSRHGAWYVSSEEDHRPPLSSFFPESIIPLWWIFISNPIDWKSCDFAFLKITSCLWDFWLVYWTSVVFTCLACCFHSVTLLCLTLCDPMDYSTPGLPVHHQLPELAQLMSTESVMPSNHLILCRSLLFLFQSLPASGSFPRSQFFVSGGQNIGVSTLASDLPVNIQDWFPLGWTGWISLQSKGLSRVFSNTTIQNGQVWEGP